jgi:hypothetical protein
VLRSEQTSSLTGLAQILALVKRSDSVPVKSEGTRVLVNVVKSLWSSDFAISTAAESLTSPVTAGAVDSADLLGKQRKRTAAVRKTLSPECAEALASLVERSGKYPLLVNEGVVALSLMSTQKEGGTVICLSPTHTQLNCSLRTTCP